MIRIKIFYIIFGLLLICDFVNFVIALKCRIEDSPSDDEMKKVIRKCIQKTDSENKDNFNNFNNHNYYQSNRDFNDEFSSSSTSDEQDNSNRLKNREHLQMRTKNRNKRFTNNDQKRQQQQQQQQQQNYGQNNNDSGNGNNQRNSNNGHQRNGKTNGTEMIDRQNGNDRNCIVHCFFEEMNMLNNNDYPDKYKILHILTKDVREHDLREFYTDSIQECFHFLEMERYKDKCVFSKTLINCMTDYARANCEDWQDHTIVFN